MGIRDGVARPAGPAAVAESGVKREGVVRGAAPASGLNCRRLKKAGTSEAELRGMGMGPGDIVACRDEGRPEPVRSMMLGGSGNVASTEGGAPWLSDTHNLCLLFTHQCHKAPYTPPTATGPRRAHACSAPPPVLVLVLCEKGTPKGDWQWPPFLLARALGSLMASASCQHNTTKQPTHRYTAADSTLKNQLTFGVATQLVAHASCNNRTSKAPRPTRRQPELMAWVIVVWIGIGVCSVSNQMEGRVRLIGGD